MKPLRYVVPFLLLIACHSDDSSPSVDAALTEDMGADAAAPCFACEGHWTCGGAVETIDLRPERDGCHLGGLPGRNLLGPDGTITADGVVVGRAIGSGARVYGLVGRMRLYFDANSASEDGRYWLWLPGTLRDLQSQGVALERGMAVTL